MDDQVEMTEAEEAAWNDARRQDAIHYLAKQGVKHGAIAPDPDWSLAPFISVWAIGSLKAPGSVGWWVICGDLPTDYCSSASCRDARSAVRAIAESWKAATDSVRPGDKTIADSGLPVSLAPLLDSRADLLLEWVDDPDIWEGMGRRPLNLS